jgi:hypothetical protein
VHNFEDRVIEEKEKERREGKEEKMGKEKEIEKEEWIR